MKLQALIPTVQHTEETDLGTEMPGITSDLEQGLSAGMEEQVVNKPLVLQRKRGQLPRQRENCMHVASGQQFPLTRLEPAHACLALASWEMPIPARVVGDFGRLSAAGAAVAMSTQRSGATALDGQQHFSVLPVDPLATVLYKCPSSTANDVSHLHERPSHELSASQTTPLAANVG